MNLSNSSTVSEATFNLRALFYAVTPAETSFDKLKDVPNIVVPSIPYFLSFLAVELIIATWKGMDVFSIADLLTSTGAGLLSRLPDYFGRSIEIASYIWIYENYCIYPLPVYSVWTWIFALLGVDFCYYWFHRASHEINILWAFHQTHHSSEYMNLSTALRQAVIQKYGSFIFYQPMALFIPPPMAIMHFQLNFLYQFWIHTEMIGKLGPVEWILNTASHHRVHHGRNPYAVDKNYAGVLIIWDRLFGTFEAERDDEKVAFGLIHNVNTFDALWLQVNHFKDVFRKVRLVWYSKKYQGKTRVVNLFKALFWGPGWFPSKAHLRMGDPKDLPAVEKEIKRYGKEMPKWLSIYCILHFLVIVAIFSITVDSTPVQERTVNLTTASTVATLLLSLCCFGFIFDQRSWSTYTEAFRCLLFLLVLIPRLLGDAYGFSSNWTQNLSYFYGASLAIIFADAFYRKFSTSKREDAHVD